MENYNEKTTIFALSTPYGKSAVALIRLSGAESLEVLRTLGYCGSIQPRIAKLVTLKIPQSEAAFETTEKAPNVAKLQQGVLDHAIVLYFNGPNSFTGQDMLELHLHGSIAVIRDTIAILQKLPYLRMAEPGEFSRLAFINGKFDLTQIEALADLIDSETSIQRQIATKQLSGQLQTLYNSWREILIETMALLEAYIDFPDDDIPITVLQQVHKNILELKKQIQTNIRTGQANTNITHGIPIVLAGQPNAGKSTLLNLLAQQDVAIVSDIAGTTRDVIRVKLDVGGFPVLVADTAGIHDQTKDSIEREGIRRTFAEIDRAFLVVWIIDLTGDIESQLDLMHERSSNVERELCLFEFATTGRMVILLNKTDAVEQKFIDQTVTEIKELSQKLTIQPKIETQHNKTVADGAIKILPFSANDVGGLPILLDAITNILILTHASPLEPVITNARQLERLKHCIEFLDNFSLDKHLDMAAQDIRFAAESLSQLTGDIELDTVLDKIFSSFCIGK